MSNPDIDLEALNEYLMSNRAPDDAMMISGLDGFLTGIAICPDPIPQSEWMAEIWGGSEPEFADTDEAKRVLGTILGRFNQIVANFRPSPCHFHPVFARGPGDLTIVTDWAAGFIDAATLRPGTWGALMDDDVMLQVLYPLLLLAAEDDERPPFGAEPATQKTLLDLYENGPEIVADCIFRIRAFWRDRGGPPRPKPRTSRRRADASRRR